MAIEHYALAREIRLVRYPEWSPMRRILECLPAVGSHILRNELLAIMRDGVNLPPDKKGSLDSYASMAKHAVELLNSDMTCVASRGHWLIGMTEDGGARCFDVQNWAKKTHQNLHALFKALGVESDFTQPDLEEFDAGGGI